MHFKSTRVIFVWVRLDDVDLIITREEVKALNKHHGQVVSQPIRWKSDERAHQMASISGSEKLYKNSSHARAIKKDRTHLDANNVFDLWKSLLWLISLPPWCPYLLPSSL
jgi:hypothetical protein